MLELTADGGRKSFFVHKSLLAAQSALLQATVGAVAEDRKIDLECWDGETVGHFVDFLYLQTYEARKPEPLFPTKESPDDTVSDATRTESRVCTPDTVRSENTVERDHSPDSTTPRPLSPISVICNDDYDAAGCVSSRGDIEYNLSIIYPQETHNYHDLLLAHAKVCALASALGIDELRVFAYHRLTVILAGFKSISPGSSLAVNTVELLRYVYDNTLDLGDPARNLVSKFAALNFPALECTYEMKECMRQGGELVVDLVEKVCRRLVASEDDLASSRENPTVPEAPPRSYSGMAADAIRNRFPW